MAAPENIGLEHLGGRAEAETFAGGGVQPGTQLSEILLGQAVGIGIATEPTSQPLVGILNRPFLPRRLSFTKPCLGTDLGLQMRPVDEFGAAIESHRTTGVPGQGRDRPGDLRHDRFRTLFLVLQHQQEPAGALDHRGDIGRTVFLPEEDQVVRQAYAAPSSATVLSHPNGRTLFDVRSRPAGTRC